MCPTSMLTTKSWVLHTAMAVALTPEAQAELLPYDETNLCRLKTGPRCSNLSIKY